MNREGHGDLYIKLNGKYKHGKVVTIMDKKDFTSVMLRYLKKK